MHRSHARTIRGRFPQQEVTRTIVTLSCRRILLFPIDFMELKTKNTKQALSQSTVSVFIVIIIIIIIIIIILFFNILYSKSTLALGSRNKLAPVES